MARTVESIQTTGGATYKKKVDAIGRTYHTREGEGRVASTSYAAAASHSAPAAAFSRNEFEPDTVDDLGHPFSAKATVPVDSFERGSAERERAAEANRWLGFRYDENTPDDPVAAAEEYYKMRKELRDADTPEKEREIKETYGIGGS